MPSSALVYSFPSPLGRRGSVALAVAGIHVLLAFALIAGLGVRISTPTPVSLIGVVVPPERTSIPPPQAPLEPARTNWPARRSIFRHRRYGSIRPRS